MNVKVAAVRYRTFNGEKHLRTFSEQAWEDMFDEHGNTLPGIRGKSGASEVGSDGHLIGADLIEMQPGSSFPLHTHPGDHILYAISGYGSVKIDGVVHRFEAGSTCYIAAERPHNVGTYPDAPGPFTLLAVGHPQKHVSDVNRMHVVEEEEIPVSLLVPMATFSGLSVGKLINLPYDRLLAIYKDWQADTPKATYLEPGERDEEKEEEKV